uniref:Uncharacterized protein n=1 Tax=Taeniopygia guttata TaxID=59729 RepID=A0A674HDD5_TAEGU
MLCNKRTFWIFDPSLLLCNWLSMNIHIQKSSITRTEGKAKVVSTYSFRFLIREDAGLSTSCEITVNFERVPGTPLVGINPVFTWMREEKGRKDQISKEFLPRDFSASQIPAPTKSEPPFMLHLMGSTYRRPWGPGKT